MEGKQRVRALFDEHYWKEEPLPLFAAKCWHATTGREGGPVLSNHLPTVLLLLHLLLLPPPSSFSFLDSLDTLAKRQDVSSSL